MFPLSLIILFKFPLIFLSVTEDLPILSFFLKTPLHSSFVFLVSILMEYDFILCIKLTENGLKTNIRSEAIKLLEENTETNFWHCSQQWCLHLIPKLREQKQRWTKGLTSNKKLLTARETINKAKKQPIEWADVFASCVYDKQLVSQIYKEFRQLNSLEITWCKNEQRTQRDISQKKT